MGLKIIDTLRMHPSSTRQVYTITPSHTSTYFVPFIHFDYLSTFLLQDMVLIKYVTRYLSGQTQTKIRSRIFNLWVATQLWVTSNFWWIMSNFEEV